MGKIARVISVDINDDDNVILTVEKEYGHNIQVELFSAFGDDTYPQEDDRVALIDIDGTGNYIAVGIITKNTGIEDGEKAIYSKDSDGNIVAKAYFQNDGKLDVITDSSITLNINEDTIICELNDDGTLNLTTDDEITINGGADINITATDNLVLQEGSDFAVRYNELKTQLDQLKQDLNTHTHNVSGVQAGGSTIASAVPTVLSTVNFTDCKVANINVPAVGE